MERNTKGIEPHQLKPGHTMGKQRMIPEGHQKLMTLPLLDDDQTMLKAAAAATGVPAAEFVRWCIHQQVPLQVVASTAGLKRLARYGKLSGQD